MTSEQKQTIQQMRSQGLVYTKIADSLGISVNTVKSFCRRANIAVCITPVDTDNKASEKTKDKCRQCGKSIEQRCKTKPRLYCSDKCRFNWWNTHKNNIGTAIVQICAYCGNEFNVHGGKKRKYCNHMCYVSARFGKGVQP